MWLQVEVLLATHLAGALHHMVTLPRLEALVHITAVNPVAPALLTGIHVGFLTANHVEVQHWQLHADVNVV